MPCAGAPPYCTPSPTVIPDAVYVKGARGRYVMINTAGARLLGKEMHRLIHHTEADGAPNSLEDCRICRGFRQGEETHVEDEVLWRADGTSFHAEHWS
jgi:hypothetical protein